MSRSDSAIPESVMGLLNDIVDELDSLKARVKELENERLEPHKLPSEETPASVGSGSGDQHSPQEKVTRSA